MIKKLMLAAICLLTIGGNAMAQNVGNAIENAQRAMGNVQSITYSGSARSVAFQQCGANATALRCEGTHDPMRPITNYERVIDLRAPASRHTGATMNLGGGGSTAIIPGTFFQQVTADQADLSESWANSLELYITPWGFLRGAAENGATSNRRSINGNSFTVVSWSPDVKAPSGASYVYVVKTYWTARVLI